MCVGWGHGGRVAWWVLVLILEKYRWGVGVGRRGGRQEARGGVVLRAWWLEGEMGGQAWPWLSLRLSKHSHSCLGIACGGHP